ncbi:MAG TPA: glycine--tRNA ligase subunit beta, partial [Nitrospira sp.]|nr:glycine--tRNA ligase subunit beta [Nitrospira sp.]
MKKTGSKTVGPKVRSSGSAELLLEIGVEELPYQFIAPALVSLKDHAGRLFEEARLSSGSIKVYGTPRRLLLVVESLAAHQTAVTKETMGPSKSVAYDQAGRPTKAAMGFAAGQGVPVENLQVRQTAKGEYLFAVKQDPGRTTRTVLLDLLPQLVGKLSFPKAMKWNETGVRFARPVRWLVALLGGVVLPIEATGIKAGNRTYGHRVLSSGKSIAVRDFGSYRKSLERAGVLVNPADRRKAIEEQLHQLCMKIGVGLNADESLLDQAVFTTEWPYAVMGNFRSEYLAVPPEILMTSMKEHQGFFSVRDKKTGKLAPHFIAVANNQLKDMSLIRSGNERVLAARLADAKFFFDEDRKTRLEERAKKLGGVTFHQKLGTMAQKQERVRKLAGFIATQLAEKEDVVQSCDRAAALCKADLLTGIVGEFPELQGIMGGEYAKHDGEPETVSQAIREQYLPKALEGELPQTLPGQVLSLADRLDSIAAFFHVGMIPTGSEDPFALRRHATAVVRIILENNLRLNLGKYIDNARNLVADSGFRGTTDSEQQGRRRIADFLFERVRHYGRSIHGLRDDVMDAVLRLASHTAIDLVDLVLKMKALQAVTARPEFDPLIVGFKRASRIVEKEQWDRKPVDPNLFKDAAETELHRHIESSRKDFDQQMAEGRYDRALDALVRLKPPIDDFFNGVMVNAEDAALRNNRLSLLKDVDDLFKSFADFS